MTRVLAFLDYLCLAYYHVKDVSEFGVRGWSVVLVATLPGNQ